LASFAAILAVSCIALESRASGIVEIIGPAAPKAEFKQKDWDAITGTLLPISPPAPYVGSAFFWATPQGESILLTFWQVAIRDEDSLRVLLRREGDLIVPLPPAIPTPAGGRGPLAVDVMVEAPHGAPRLEHVGAWVTFTLDSNEPIRDGRKWTGTVVVKPGQTLKVRRFTDKLASEVREVSPWSLSR